MRSREHLYRDRWNVVGSGRARLRAESRMRVWAAVSGQLRPDYGTGLRLRTVEHPYREWLRGEHRMRQGRGSQSFDVQLNAWFVGFHLRSRQLRAGVVTRVCC